MRTQTAARDKDFTETIANLSEEKKKIAIDFLAYLKDKDEWDATLEILSNQKFIQGILKGKRDIKEGKSHKWEDVKRNV